MKIIISIFGLLVLLTVIAAGCSSGESSGDGDVTLTLYSTITNEAEKEMLKKVIGKFEEKNPDINIESNFPAGEYESLLRVKMAANDMPDLFDTHGWAKNRYGEYVADLSGMGWVQNLDPAMEPILTDEEGKVYAFPMNQAKDGISFNANLLNKYGIEPPTTFDTFMAALETIEEKSNGEVVPFWFNGADKSALGQYFDQFASPLLITDKQNDYSKELLNGKFDWSHYTFLPEKLKEMHEKGLLNEDILTAKNSQKVRLMAQGKIGFLLGGGSLGTEVEKLNPDLEVGMVPMPVIHEGDTPSWIGGERHTMAAWKDSKHLKEAKKFISFLAQPEIAKQVAEGTALPSALTNVEADNYYSKYYKMFKEAEIQPYFDRVYLPSGMWDVMGSTGQELLSGTMTPEQVSQKMAEEYERLRNEGK